MSLTKRAAEIHPCRRNAAKWVLAIRWMRSRNLWVFEGGAAKWEHKNDTSLLLQKPDPYISNAFSYKKKKPEAKQLTF